MCSRAKEFPLDPLETPPEAIPPQQETSQVARPTAIKVVALIWFLYVAWAFLGSILILLRTDNVMLSFALWQRFFVGFWGGFALLLDLTALPLAALMSITLRVLYPRSHIDAFMSPLWTVTAMVLIAVGLWRLQNWARRLAVYASALAVGMVVVLPLLGGGFFDISGRT